MSTPYEPLSQGYQEGRGTESPGLERISDRWNEQAQSSIGRPQSVLNQLAPSPVAANLSAPSQRQRLLPNGYQLPNFSVGSSPQTAEATANLRLKGDNSIQDQS